MMHYYKHIFLVIFLLSLTFSRPVQAQNEYIAKEQVEEYAQYWRTQDGFEYLKAFEAAKKLFVVGKKVDKALLDKHFNTWGFAGFGEFADNDLWEYTLFSGGNGIIGQVVILFVNEDEEVVKVELTGWGR